MKLLLKGFAVAALLCAIALGTALAGDGAMRNCPAEGEWGLVTWAGDDGTDVDEALAGCPVQIAYALRDGGWTSDPGTVNKYDALLVLGGAGTVPAVPEPTYINSDALPDLSGQLDIGIKVLARGLTPTRYAPTSVEPADNGDLVIGFEFFSMSPPKEIIFYNHGDEFYRTDGPPLCTEIEDRRGVQMGVDCFTYGYRYTYEVHVRANGSFKVEMTAEAPENPYIGREAPSCFNPTCPTHIWEKQPDSSMTCPGYPDAEYGLCACPTEEDPDATCSRLGPTPEPRRGNR